MITEWKITLVLLLISMTGCTANSRLPTSLASPIPTPSPSASAAPGSRAVKIIFQQSSSGSFDEPSSGGTTASPGSGLQATRIFNPDGTLLATSGSADWPGWFSSFEIGVSGSNNSSALNPDCAKFAAASESALVNCHIGNPAADTSCGAPSAQFRVSEADCSIAAAGLPVASAGSGGPADGVYFRAAFSRSTGHLGVAENILVVLEYASSGLNTAPANPTACLSAGQLKPESCADFVWRAYLKHSASEITQSFFLIVPPMFASVLGTGNSSGLNVATRQFVLPLAADQTLTHLQISRVSSNFTTPAATAALLASCSVGGALPANSPLCAGMVFISMTFFRI